MVYIYKKTVGNKEYYYLRASTRKKDKVIAKDIIYLGDNLEAVKEKLKEIPSKYSGQIRKTYKTINRFMEINHFLDKVKATKLKKEDFMSKEALENIEACKLHWENKFLKLDELTKDEVLKGFIIEFAFNTTSIEGNTITLKQAQSLLHDNLTPANKTLREVFDLQNTEKVFFELFKDTGREINHELIIDIHDKLLENIDPRKGYRTRDVRVFKATFKSSPAQYVKIDMNLLLKWYKENNDKMNPFALALIFHHKFERIHPFMDGNGRTGRMLMNYILLTKGYPPLMIRKKNRSKYIMHMSKADKSELTKAKPEDYNGLIEFGSSEMKEGYWNIFL